RAAAAGGLEGLVHRVEVPAVPGPAAGGQSGAADVEADGDLVAEAGDHLGRPLGVLERGGADVHALGTGVQRPLQALGVTDPAGELDLDAHGLDHLVEQAGVRSASECRVEVDEVDPFGSPVLEILGRVDG